MHRTLPKSPDRCCARTCENCPALTPQSNHGNHTPVWLLSPAPLSDPAFHFLRESAAPSVPPLYSPAFFFSEILWSPHFAYRVSKRKGLPGNSRQSRNSVRLSDWSRGNLQSVRVLPLLRAARWSCRPRSHTGILYGTYIRSEGSTAREHLRSG